MGIENHELHKEFPQYSTLIDELRANDPHFQEQLHRYSELDQTIEGLELQGTPTSDDHFSQLKQERLHLKDSLYRALVEASSAPAG